MTASAEAKGAAAGLPPVHVIGTGLIGASIGLALRGTFIVDKQGRVAYKVVNAIPDARDLDEYRKVLADL